MTMGSLTVPRRTVTKKLAEIIVDNSSSGSCSSPNFDCIQDIKRDEVSAAIGNLARSTSATDKRYLDLVTVEKNHRAALQPAS